MNNKKQKEVILFLGPEESEIFKWLQQNERKVYQAMDKITPDFVDQMGVTFLVSYGYRHIIGKNILNKLGQNAVNLHISYLPWNRGADPNFWSFVDNTPKGVSIHYLDTGIDTGDIIVQKEIVFRENEFTVYQTYRRLQVEIEILFKQHWQSIQLGNCSRTKQKNCGTFHLEKEKYDLFKKLSKGWHSSVRELKNLKENKVNDNGLGY